MILILIYYFAMMIYFEKGENVEIVLFFVVVVGASGRVHVYAVFGGYTWDAPPPPPPPPP